VFFLRIGEAGRRRTEEWKEGRRKGGREGALTFCQGEDGINGALLAAVLVDPALV